MSFSRFSRPSGGSDSDDDQSEREQKPSLMDRLKSVQAAYPPKPKPFHMSEPFVQPGGLWCFWLTADTTILQFVATLNCIMQMPAPPFARSAPGRVMYAISPRYNHEEAWLWIYRLLESETEFVELSELWDQAIEDEEEGDLS
jgi:hypothetical protein